MDDVDLVGNALCLDFTNTVNKRPATRRDLLAGPSGVMAWAEAAGLTVDVRLSRRHLADIRELREGVFAVFDSLARDQAPPRRSLDRLKVSYALVVAKAEWTSLDPGHENPRLSWSRAPGAAKMTGPILDSAMALLRAGPLDRVRACPSCGWLFLDTSRNNQRRWCSMTMCGSRSKSAAYFARTRSAGPEEH